MSTPARKPVIASSLLLAQGVRAVQALGALFARLLLPVAPPALRLQPVRQSMHRPATPARRPQRPFVNYGEW